MQIAIAALLLFLAVVQATGLSLHEQVTGLHRTCGCISYCERCIRGGIDGRSLDDWQLAEVRAENERLRHEHHAEVASLRAGHRAEVASLRAELASLRAQLRVEGVEDDEDLELGTETTAGLRQRQASPPSGSCPTHCQGNCNIPTFLSRKCMVSDSMWKKTQYSVRSVGTAQDHKWTIDVRGRPTVRCPCRTAHGQALNKAEALRRILGQVAFLKNNLSLSCPG